MITIKSLLEYKQKTIMLRNSPLFYKLFVRWTSNQAVALLTSSLYSVFGRENSASLFFAFSHTTNRPGPSFLYSDRLITGNPKHSSWATCATTRRLIPNLVFKMALLLSSLLAFDFTSSGDIGDDTLPKLYERNPMSEYFERLICECMSR